MSPVDGSCSLIIIGELDRSFFFFDWVSFEDTFGKEEQSSPFFVGQIRELVGTKFVGFSLIGSNVFEVSHEDTESIDFFFFGFIDFAVLDFPGSPFTLGKGGGGF